MKKALFIIFSIVVVGAVVYYKDAPMLNLVGIATTMLGFIWLIYQNTEIKNIAVESKKVAEDAKSQIFFFDISTKIPETRKTIEQIKRELHELDMSKLRIVQCFLTDLINSLVEINHNKSITKFLQGNVVSKFIEEMNNANDEIDDAILNANLTYEKIQNFACNFSLKLNLIDAFLNNINAEIKNNGGKHNG